MLSKGQGQFNCKKFIPMHPILCLKNKSVYNFKNTFVSRTEKKNDRVIWYTDDSNISAEEN